MTASTSAAAAKEENPFSVASFRRRVADRLSFLPPDAAQPSFGDHVLDKVAIDPASLAAARLAAVLIPVVARDRETTVLLTQRADALRDHSGQIAFPGGKIDPSDRAPIDAALREAEEEIGLTRRVVEPLAYLDPYLTGTNYRIIPVVALVTPPFELTLNPREVDSTFEVPLRFLMQEANHQRHQLPWRGRLRSYYAMPYGGRYIWGATAGIVRNLYERLYS